MRKGSVYLIPAPLGDNSDTDRILPPFVEHIINTIDHYIVENEKSARHYLKKLNIQKPLKEIVLFPLNKHTPIEDISSYLNPALEGKPMGVISEAGCPGVADPGAEIVKLAHQKNIRVIPLVGPSSILLSLMASGMNGQSFTFHGYLPVESAERQKKLKEIELQSKKSNQTQIFIETPYRNEKILADIFKSCNSSTLLTIASEVTLPSEFIKTKSISEWKNIKIDIQKKPAVFLIQAQ